MPKKETKKETKKAKPPKKENIVQKIEKHPIFVAQRTFGQRASDNLTKWAGSWLFIFGFIVFMILWMAANVYAWVNTWDPYPFILLNLALSCLAAIQAPIILMSQNREMQKDRIRSEYDYSVNRKAEKEIQEIKKMLEDVIGKKN